jgi:hypothetical protein
MGRIMAMIAAGVFAGGAAAQPIYKCSVGGKVSYADHPCAHGTASELAAPPPAADAPGAAAQLERDKARLAELEKRRSERQALEEREGARAARAAAAARQKCERLRLQARWAGEDLVEGRSTTGRKATSAARLKARRQAEALAVECPA